MSLFCAKCSAATENGDAYCSMCRIPDAPLMSCNRCGETDHPKLTWQPLHGGGYHLRAECASCGSYLKFVSQTEGWAARLAGPRP